MAAVVRSRFYSTIALVLALLMAVGFARTFYLSFLFDVPAKTLLLHLHGLVFSVWMVLFVVQTRLVAANNVRAHMRLGIAGVVVAALVFVFGMMTAFVSASAARPRGLGMTSAQFVIVPVGAITMFAICVTAALLLRRRAQLHKRLMVLAMIAVLGPPVARIINLLNGGDHFLVLQMSVTAAFVIWCLAHDWLKYRMVHPVYLLGGGFIVLSWPLRAFLGRTEAWESIGRWMAVTGQM